MNTKKTFLLLFTLILSVSYSQNKLSFADQKTGKFKNDLSKNFKTYKILKLNSSTQKTAKSDQINISFGQDYNYTLKENKILANNYVVSLKGANGLERKTISDIGFTGKYYTNADISANNQLVFSTFENKYSIYIKNSKEEFYIEPLKKYNKNALSSDYVLYNTKDVIETEKASCETNNIQSNLETNKTAQTSKTTVGGCKTVDLAFSIDYTMYSTYGSVNAVIDRTLQILNLSQANYTILNGLSDDVQLKVVEHYVVTCDACNYWPSSLDININYSQFPAYAYKMFVNTYDTKVHWQNQGGPGTFGGIASIGNMCNGSSVIIKNFATNNDKTRNIFSHELGHNFGCVHDTDIMAAVLNGSNIWSAASKVSINNTLNTSTCISTCNTNICDNKKVTNAVVTTDLINDKINVSWLAETGIDFKVRLFNILTNTWTPSTTFVSPSNSTSFNFTQTHCIDKYKVEITPVCSGIDGIKEQINVNTVKNVAAPSLAFSSAVQNQNICGSNLPTFSVSAIDGGLAPVYQWKINSINTGTNSPFFTPTSLNNNDILSCDLTSNDPCVTSKTASVSTTLSVTAPTVLSVLVTASATNICPGESVTLTATATNLGSFPGYTWKLNGLPTQLSGSIITVTPVTTGDVYTCIVFDNGCHTTTAGAISNPVTITIRTDCALSVDEFSISGLNYYPNPVKDFITISAKEEISTIKVYNLLGQKVISKTINSEKTTLDLSNLSKASYFLKIETQGKTKTIKVIKD